jgi:hypothetical protein
MIFYKLSAHHKKLFIINQIVLFVALLIMALIAINMAGLKLPSNESKISATFGFILVGVVLMFALLNRISILFKIRSIGFVILWSMFMLLEYIIDPLKWAFGLMMIPLLIDDMIFKPIWNNIWYNEYDK